ncbi:SOS response-associated peptidase [Corynebacterium auriscanis]|uniref:SOS response-associated peptidase n=1 Tax=Corynebacterium auriscanis TaxID=99807 RepID=UPI003CF0812E
MCGRYVLFSTTETLVKGLERELPGVGIVGSYASGNQRPNYNIAPTHVVPIARMFHGQPAIGPAHWGYPPRTVFNARGETAFEKPTFRGSLTCLFPMDGWYEWTTTDPEGRAEPSGKQPYFTAREDGEPLWMAGLCKVVDGRLHSTIITTDAPPGMEWLHNRMPKALTPDQWEFWLTATVGSSEMRELAATPAGEGVVRALSSRKADRAVGNVSNNYAELIGG